MGTTQDNEYISQSARLASFSQKRPRGQKWPYSPSHSITPTSLASAGFYHSPQVGAADSATCFFCSKTLNGWESGDDALDEHLSHTKSRPCAWAIMKSIERMKELELDFELSYSLSELESFRRSTFGELWPHDGKKGWKPTADRLAIGGFYFALGGVDVDVFPDMAACPYCGLCLDGWEKSDDPTHEHKSRRPNCHFFTLNTVEPIQLESSQGDWELISESVPDVSTSKKPAATTKKKPKPKKIVTAPSSPQLASPPPVSPKSPKRTLNRTAKPKSPLTASNSLAAIAAALEALETSAPSEVEAVPNPRRVTRSRSNTVVANSLLPSGSKLRTQPVSTSEGQHSEPETEPPVMEVESSQPTASKGKAKAKRRTTKTRKSKAVNTFVQSDSVEPDLASVRPLTAAEIRPELLRVVDPNAIPESQKSMPLIDWYRLLIEEQISQSETKMREKLSEFEKQSAEGRESLKTLLGLE